MRAAYLYLSAPGGHSRQGTADLTDDAQEILERIALTAMSPDSKITVTGHTDDIPISGGKFRDNWDLAAGRASSVVQAIEGTGLISADRLSAVSKGETDHCRQHDCNELRVRKSSH